MNPASVPIQIKPKDYKSALKPVWCPGCGDFAVLNAMTKTTFYIKIQVLK